MPAPPGLFESASSKRDRLHSEISAGSRRGSPSGCIPNRHTTHGGPGDRRGLRIMRIVEAKLLEHPLEHDEQRGERQRDDGHEVDEDVHGRAGGILEGIAHGIAHNGGLMVIGAFSAILAASMYFLALSHAPPALDMKIAISTPVTSAPESNPPRDSTPRTIPNDQRYYDCHHTRKQHFVKSCCGRNCNA